MAGIAWTPERDRQLRALWTEGQTSNKIAVIMGLTRNAVIGRVYRTHKLSHPRLRRNATIVPTASPVLRNVEFGAASDSISFMEMACDQDRCKWPYDDRTFCGHTVEKRPYCPHHTQMALRQ